MLDELDKELERRGHRLCRYADDCMILVKSQKAGERVMESVKRFVTRKLRLKVNEAKSKVATAKFLMKGGVPEWGAWRLAMSRKGWYRKAASPQALVAMSNKWFSEMKLIPLALPVV